jgi:uncharacterized membrane protein
MKKELEGKDRKPRYLIIDVMRGFAVLLMIIFHIAFDLNSFGFVSIDFFENVFWFGFPRFIVMLFLICVGVSLSLVHKDGIKWVIVRIRFFKIGGWALIVSAVTYVLFPRHFVYFGILHCIAVSSVVGVFFVRLPKMSLLVGLLMVTSNAIFHPTLFPISDWIGVSPIDYIPFYPYFGIVLVGIFLESVNFHRIPMKRSFLTRPLEIMGQHSLKIYLIHRPVIYGLFIGLYRLKH